MNSKLAELFQKKHYWEVKRDKLCHRILWDYQRNAFWFLFLVVYIFLFLQKGTIFFRGENGWEWYNVIRILVFAIGMFFWWLTLVRNVFDCYYKLPRYRRKINDLNHQIVEELKKLNT